MLACAPVAFATFQGALRCVVLCVQLIKGHTLTCFSDAEEQSSGKDKLVPFLLESRLRENGAEVVTGELAKPCLAYLGCLLPSG